MFIRACTVFTATCLAATSLMAADSPFVGKWKANLGKSQTAGSTMKVEATGSNAYKMTFGDQGEDFIADGKEHPTLYGSMRTITLDGANHWNAVSKRDGQITSTGSIVLSEDGQTLTRTFEIHQPDGKMDKEVYKAKRTAGTSGLVGAWEDTDAKIGADIEVELQPFEGDGLTVINAAYKEHDNVKFDGKDYPNEGPRVAPGAATSGKKIDEHTLELVNKLNGKPTDTERLEVSADGKTLTMTDTPTGDNEIADLRFRAAVKQGATGRPVSVEYRA